MKVDLTHKYSWYNCWHYMTRLLPKWHIPLTSSHSFLRLAVTCLSWEAARSHRTMEKPVCSCSKSEAELRLWPSGLWRPVGIHAARGTRENLGAWGSKAPEGTAPAPCCFGCFRVPLARLSWCSTAPSCPQRGALVFPRCMAWGCCARWRCEQKCCSTP